MKLLGRYIHGSHRRNDGLAASGARVSAAAPRFVAAGNGGSPSWCSYRSVLLLVRGLRPDYDVVTTPVVSAWGQLGGFLRRGWGRCGDLSAMLWERLNCPPHPRSTRRTGATCPRPDAVDEEVGRSDPHERFPGAPSEPRPKQEILTRDNTPTGANASSIYRDSTRSICKASVP